MKLCCFLCFGEEEENSKEKKGIEGSGGSSMSDGILRNVVEGVPEDMEKDESEDFELEFTQWGLSMQAGDGETQAADMSEDGVGTEGGVDEDGTENWGEDMVNLQKVQPFDQPGPALNPGTSKANLNLGLSDKPSSSSSLIPTALDRNEFDRDMQNKRPKVQSFSL